MHQIVTFKEKKPANCWFTHSQFILCVLTYKMSRCNCFSTTHLQLKPFVLAPCKFVPMLQIKSLLGNKNAEFNEWMSRNNTQLHKVWCSRRPGLRLTSDGTRSVFGVQYRLPLCYPLTEHTPRCTSHHKTLLLLLILHQHVNQKVYQSAVAGFPLTSLPLLHLARRLSSSFCLCFYSPPLLRSPSHNHTFFLSSSWRREDLFHTLFFPPCCTRRREPRYDSDSR